MGRSSWNKACAASHVFSSPMNDPVLRALLVPLSGLGAFGLIQEGILPF